MAATSFTPPRAPALNRTSWISYSPDAPLSPSSTSAFPFRTSYTRPRPGSYRACLSSSLPKLYPPPRSARSPRQSAAEQSEDQEGHTSVESEEAWVDVEGEVFGGDRFSNIFVLSSSPSSSMGSSGHGNADRDKHAGIDSPPTSNASTPPTSAQGDSSPFGDVKADSRYSLQSPLSRRGGASFLTPTSATFSSPGDESDFTPVPLTPLPLSTKSDAAIAAWTAQLYAYLASPSPKKNLPFSSRRSRSGTLTPHHPFHYSRTSPIHSPLRSPARSRQGSLTPVGRRKGSVIAKSDRLAPSPGLHSPIRLGRNYPILALSPPPPVVARRKSAVALAKKEARRRRRAEEVATKPIQMDMAALDSFFGVKPEEAGKASRSGYGGLGLEREPRAEREGQYSEFRSLLRDQEEEEDDATREGRKRRPPPLDLSHARNASTSTALGSWDDVTSPVSADSYASGSLGAEELGGPVDDHGVGDPLSREIRRRKSDDWRDQGRKRLSQPLQRRLGKKKSVAGLLMGLMFREKDGRG